MVIPEVFLNRFQDHKINTKKELTTVYKILSNYQPHEICVIRTHINKHTDDRRYQMLNGIVHLSDMHRAPWNKSLKNQMKKIEKAYEILFRLFKKDEDDIEVVNCLRLYHRITEEPFDQLEYDIRYHHLKGTPNIIVDTELLTLYVMSSCDILETYLEQKTDYEMLVEKYNKLKDKYRKLKYAPDGIGYQKAKEHFESLAK